MMLFNGSQPFRGPGQISQTFLAQRSRRCPTFLHQLEAKKYDDTAKGWKLRMRNRPPACLLITKQKKNCQFMKLEATMNSKMQKNYFLGSTCALRSLERLLLNTLSTSILISPSFQGDPTIFHQWIFLKQTPHIKN